MRITSSLLIFNEPETEKSFEPDEMVNFILDERLLRLASLARTLLKTDIFSASVLVGEPDGIEVSVTACFVPHDTVANNTASHIKPFNRQAFLLHILLFLHIFLEFDFSDQHFIGFIQSQSFLPIFHGFGHVATHSVDVSSMFKHHG